MRARRMRMIEIKNLVKHYGQIRAVNDISFTVNQGEILGFLGPNGAGKSTTMNILTGFLSATAGSVKINGYDILEEPHKAKSCIGYLPENPPLYLDMTVLEYLKFVCDLKGVPREERAKQLAEIMRLVRITDVANRLTKNLSKGYRQRVGIAQALVGNPEVLVLDEPTIGLDPKQIIEIRNLVRDLGRKHTVILSSHILPEVSAVCDRIIIINKGVIAAVDTPDNLSRKFSKSTRLQVAVEGPLKDVITKLRRVPGVRTAELLSEKEGGVNVLIVESEGDSDVRKPVFFEMARSSYAILEMRPLDLTLEEVFLQVTGNAPTGKGEK
jgi:ABC-2 type transport system ATP-binding protein